MALGSKASTTVANLKVLKQIYTKATTVFCYRDQSFPRNVAGAPCSATLDRVRSCAVELADFYKGTGKMSIQETFHRRMDDVASVPMVNELVKLALQMRRELPEKLSKLEGIAEQNDVLEIADRPVVVEGRKRRMNVEVNHIIKPNTKSILEY